MQYRSRHKKKIHFKWKKLHISSTVDNPRRYVNGAMGPRHGFQIRNLILGEHLVGINYRYVSVNSRSVEPDGVFLNVILHTDWTPTLAAEGSHGVFRTLVRLKCFFYSWIPAWRSERRRRCSVQRRWPSCTWNSGTEAIGMSCWWCSTGFPCRDMTLRWPPLQRRSFWDSAATTARPRLGLSRLAWGRYSSNYSVTFASSKL